MREPEQKTNAGVIILVVAGILALLAIGKSFLDRPRAVPASVVTQQSEVQPQQVEPQSAGTSQRSQERIGRVVSDFSDRFGKESVVIVSFPGIKAKTDVADRYLTRRLFRAAYQNYAAASLGSTVDRISAEDIRQRDVTWNLYDGPEFVAERYPPLRSNLPYPRVSTRVQDGGTFTYVVVPVLDVTEFADRLGLGSIVQKDDFRRTLAISSNLDNTTPHPDVEEMRTNFGENSVARIVLDQAVGEPDRIAYFLSESLSAIEADPPLAVAGVEFLEAERYEFFVAPVADLSVLSSKISFGTLADINLEGRTLRYIAKLPQNLPRRPTAAMIAVQRERQRNERAALQQRNNQLAPAPGEDVVDWALTALRSGQPNRESAALRELAVVAVNPDRREEVSKVLMAMLNPNGRNTEGHLNAILNWRTEESDRLILSMGGSNLPPQSRFAFMNAMSVIGTAEAARILALYLDSTSGDECVPRLIKMGPIAEDAVLALITHEDVKVRNRVYLVLADIGTEKSVLRLTSSARTERENAQKAKAREAVAAIRKRENSEKSPDAPDADVQ